MNKSESNDYKDEDLNVDAVDNIDNDEADEDNSR